MNFGLFIKIHFVQSLKYATLMVPQVLILLEI